MAITDEEMKLKLDELDELRKHPGVRANGDAVAGNLVAGPKSAMVQYFSDCINLGPSPKRDPAIERAYRESQDRETKSELQPGVSHLVQVRELLTRTPNEWVRRSVLPQVQWNCIAARLRNQGYVIECRRPSGRIVAGSFADYEYRIVITPEALIAMLLKTEEYQRVIK